MDAIQAAFDKRDSEVMVSFGIRLKDQFSLNKAYRRPKELEWLESLRQYKGLYDPDVKIDKNASKVYPKITRSKINIVLSRLHEMLFPETDRNWEGEPTPEPKIAKELVTEIAKALVHQDPQTGALILPTADELRLAIKEFAKVTCEKMVSEIDDQLCEMDYSELTKKILRSGLMYGTGIMKGPLIGKKTKRRWQPGAEGDYEEIVNDQDVPDLQVSRIWDWYPDMTVTEVEKMQGSFERHVMGKHDLRQLMKREDFFADVIKAHLEQNPDGDYAPENWETDLQVIEVEAGTGEGVSISTGSTTSLSQSSYRQLGKKYEVLEHWGYIDGSDLQACGLNIEDATLEYGANIWLLGKKIIKAVLYDRPLDQYKVFYYEKDETSIFGEGLARIMRHSQLAVSAGARMVLDNGACAAGPQVEVNWSMMTPDTDVSSFYPRKIWYREGRGVDAQYPAVRVYNIDSHIDELLKIIDAFKQFGDEETTLPTWMIGQMVNNETAQATSGRMATITISIKDVVKNFDAFTEKLMRDLYAWNMEFNPRQDIKGDFSFKARGVSSLVMKEIRMQALAQLSTTLTDSERDYIPEGEFVKEKFKAHDITIKLRTEEEVQKLREERQQSIQNQLALKMAEAEIKYKQSQTMAMLTKAKSKNVEANIAAQTPIEQPEGSDPRMQDAELQGQQTDNMGKEAEIRRQDEAHTLEMSHSDEKHRQGMAIETAKTAHEIAQKEKMTDAAVETKKKLADAAAKAKKAAPATKKTVKPAQKAQS